MRISGCSSRDFSACLGPDYGKRQGRLFFVSAAGCMLLSYVLGVLISHPEIPLVLNGMLSRLSGESAFTLMGLLGSNIMPRNFYLHSFVALCALWDLDSDQHFNVGRCDVLFADENARLSFKRSLSDGNIVSPSDDPMSATNVAQRNQGECSHLLDDSKPKICDSDISLSRFTAMASRQLFTDMQSTRIQFQEDSHSLRRGRNYV